MKVICESCGDEVVLPNKKNHARKTSNKNHSIVMCRQCGHKNFVNALTRYDLKREEYTGRKDDD
jgi:RNase P subunit RPR2